MSQLGIVPLSSWFINSESNCLLVAGPCSAESFEQVDETATSISKLKSVSVFRAGVWKPRTRPGSFEGKGVEALTWLKEAKQKTGLRMAVEVAKAEHVEQCMKYGIDVLWIGARTTSNPFSVQEIADALRGIDIPVMVKNPLNPDLSLWIGAIERVNKVGVKRLAAVHRGFYPYEETRYRNIPKWELAIELKSMFHELPILCDPSHIAGDSHLVPDIAQKALDMNMNGLMIETHIDPSQALSDAKQQLTPFQLEDLLNRLKFRVKEINDEGLKTALHQLRLQIDSIDYQMLELLGRRMDLVERIGEEKWKKNISVLQLDRWEKMRDERLLFAERLNLPKFFVKKILQLIHKESIVKQTEIMGKLNKEGE